MNLSTDLGQTKDLGKEERTVSKEVLVEWDRYVCEMDMDGICPEYRKIFLGQHQRSFMVIQFIVILHCPNECIDMPSPF